MSPTPHRPFKKAPQTNEFGVYRLLELPIGEDYTLKRFQRRCRQLGIRAIRTYTYRIQSSRRESTVLPFGANAAAVTVAADAPPPH